MRVMLMKWHDLCFLHWPVPAEALQPHLPAGLELDTYEGQAWLGLVPFWMSDVRPNFGPPLPEFVSKFPEFNVRTYVRDRTASGVWFFSLDAAQWLAVRVARKVFHLAYYDARMEFEWKQGWCSYHTQRTHRGSAAVRFQGRYRPVGEAFRAAPGSLEEWMTERYWLFSADPRGRVYRARIEHPPWPLQNAEAEVEYNDMESPLGLRLQGPPSSVLFGGYQRVYGHPLERAEL